MPSSVQSTVVSPSTKETSPGWTPPTEIPQRIETERLVIRPYVADDLSSLLEVQITNPDFQEYDQGFTVYDDEKCKERLERSVENYRIGKQFGMAIIERETGQYLGETGLWGGWAFGDPSGTADTGYEIRADRRNEGFATEAVSGVLDCAFKSQADGGFGFRQVTSTTTTLNAASQSVAKKLGMRLKWESKEARKTRLHGLVGEVQFAILQEEWDSTRALKASSTQCKATSTPNVGSIDTETFSTAVVRNGSMVMAN